MGKKLTRIGTIEEFPELKQIFEGIFSRRKVAFPSTSIPGQTIETTFLRRSECWAVYLGDKCFVEQNPKKSSRSAEKARRGVKIVWVINQKTNDYEGLIEEGEVFMYQHILDQQQQEVRGEEPAKTDPTSQLSAGSQASLQKVKELLQSRS